MLDPKGMESSRPLPLSSGCSHWGTEKGAEPCRGIDRRGAVRPATGDQHQWTASTAWVVGEVDQETWDYFLFRKLTIFCLK